MSDGPIIAASGAGKAYRIWQNPASRLTAPLLKSVSGMLPGASGRGLKDRAERSYRDFWALRNVSFEIHAGESMGIIGRNGSGKSTLLQIIAGTLQPTEGDVQVKGRVAALLELGSGFNHEFTGRENVYLNAAVLGLTRQEVDARFDAIAAFADIGDFIDQPVKTYSSGMFVRLAFAVQTAVEPQVLIVDEALSVGDVFFQQRCYERMQQLLDTGVCVILASHDLASVQRYCRNTLVLQRGKVMYFGPATEGTKTYLLLEQQERAAAFSANAPAITPVPPTGPAIPGWPAAALPVPIAGQVIGNGWARCTGLAVGTPAGEPCLHFRQGETLSVFYEFEILHDMEFCVGCVTIRDKTNQAVHSKITLQDGVRGPARVAKGTRLRFRQDTVLNIHCADYTLDVALEMISARLLDQAGISYDEFMAAQLRICELHAVAGFTVRLREETAPFQLLHFGTAGLPSHSVAETVLPGGPDDAPLVAAPDGPDVAYVGDFPDFSAAQARSTGYGTSVILERTRAALQKVLRGEAAYERDSATFDRLELPGPLLDLLNRIAAAQGGRLSVLDFGGSLGSTYYQCRGALAHLAALEWSIVEQPAHVACGQGEFSTAQLRFYPTIAACLRERRPSVLLLSSVLQYLPEPWTFLREAATHGFDWIILDRTPFIPAERDRLTVEVVSPRIYPASYPAWFLSRPRLQKELPAGWEIVSEFDALDRQLLDGVELTFKGLALRRST